MRFTTGQPPARSAHDGFSAEYAQAPGAVQAGVRSEPPQRLGFPPQRSDGPPRGSSPRRAPIHDQVGERAGPRDSSSRRRSPTYRRPGDAGRPVQAADACQSEGDAQGTAPAMRGSGAVAAPPGTARPACLQAPRRRGAPGRRGRRRFAIRRLVRRSPAAERRANRREVRLPVELIRCSESPEKDLRRSARPISAPSRVGSRGRTVAIMSEWTGAIARQKARQAVLISFVARTTTSACRVDGWRW